MSNHSLETGLSAEVRDRLYAVRQQLSRYSFFESACLVLLASALFYAAMLASPLDEVMLAMDVVDTLRHRERILERELSADERAAVEHHQDVALRGCGIEQSLHFIGSESVWIRARGACSGATLIRNNPPSIRPTRRSRPSPRSSESTSTRSGS